MVSTGDLLSEVLRSVRFSGVVQFCVMPTGDWQIDAGISMKRMGLQPGRFVPFHVVAKGSVWLKTCDRFDHLESGDVVMFPFATPHEMGVGEDGPQLSPSGDLPPPPWSTIPVLEYGEGPEGAKILCGYMQCSALTFEPLRASLPDVLLAHSSGETGGWLQATIRQLELEVEHRQAGSSSMLERLTETMFIQVLRQHVDAAANEHKGWLVAAADPQLGRCLSAIHKTPQREWTIDLLATTAGASRSVLAERFQQHLGISPIRYVRDWRLHLASLALVETDASVAAIAFDAGYSSEAAFNRAFSRAYGQPPSAWRRSPNSSPTSHECP
jgi:AraC-like DNA-binding protein